MDDRKSRHVGLIPDKENVDIGVVRQRVAESDPDAKIGHSDALGAHVVLTDNDDAALVARMTGNAKFLKQPK